MKLKEVVGDWDRFLYEVFYDNEIMICLNKINTLYNNPSLTIYPKQENVFKAFQECPFSKLAVVILLQDPYHDGSATGIALANSENSVKLSPSLISVRDNISRTIYNKNIFNFDKTLVSWANQGVLLLNSALTVEKASPLSHNALWHRFTRLLLVKLSLYNSGIIYCLWGKYAESYNLYINSVSNTILYAEHPVYSSYSGKPWNCDHFVKINEQLKKFNNLNIIW